MSAELYRSAIRPDGCLGAAFERDDETAYFYLLDLRRPAGSRVISTYTMPAFLAVTADAGVRVCWTHDGNMAGLVADGKLLAVFEVADAALSRTHGRAATCGDRCKFDELYEN